MNEFTMKNTKTEMVQAYNDLLKKYQDVEKLAKSVPQEVKAKKVAEEKIVKVATDLTSDKIIKGVGDLKIHINKTLTDVSDKLLGEEKKLGDIQQAIEIQKKHLEELYDIQVAAGTVHQLIQEHEEKKIAFETEMTTTRDNWEKEQESHQALIVERNAQVKKEREREQDEFDYSLKITRKKDKDAYDEKKVLLEKELKEKRETQEKELTEREAVVVAQETELADLKAQVDAFPKELETAVAAAEKEIVEQTKKEALQNANLIGKETEGALKLAEQKIKTLEETVAKQNAQINTLSKQLQDATSQVQGIALKAIEGASGVKALSAVNEIALEQAKNVRETK